MSTQAITDQEFDELGFIRSGYRSPGSLRWYKKEVTAKLRFKIMYSTVSNQITLSRFDKQLGAELNEPADYETESVLFDSMKIYNRAELEEFLFRTYGYRSIFITPLEYRPGFSKLKSSIL